MRSYRTAVNNVVSSLADSIVSHATSFDCDDLEYDRNSHVATLRHDEGIFDFVQRD